MAASSPLDQHSSPVADHGTTSGKATASMVVGIVGVVLAILREVDALLRRGTQPLNDLMKGRGDVRLVLNAFEVA